jgi:Adenylosuccinate synthetase
LLFPSCKGKSDFAKLSTEAKDFISKIERETGVPVTLIGTGPGDADIIDRRRVQEAQIAKVQLVAKKRPLKILEERP